MQAHVLPRAATMTGTRLNICVSSSNRLEAGGKYFSFQCIFGLLCIFWPVAVVLFSTASQIIFCGIKPQQLCRVQGGAGLTEAKRCWGRNTDLFWRSDLLQVFSTPIFHLSRSSLFRQQLLNFLKRKSQTQESHCLISGFFIVP